MWLVAQHGLKWLKQYMCGKPSQPWGWLSTFQRGNVADLERMIRLLLAESQVRKEAARAAQERIRAHYLWPQIALEIEREYLSLAGWQESVAPAVAGATPMRGSAA